MNIGQNTRDVNRNDPAVARSKFGVGNRRWSRANAEARGENPGFERAKVYDKLSSLSGGVVERFCDARLEWLRSRERHFLGERRKLLGLLGQRFELFGCMFGRKF
jgi:hypothetical protein